MTQERRGRAGRAVRASATPSSITWDSPTAFPCVRGMRIRVVDILDWLASGMSREEILEDYPELEPEDIDASLRFARNRVDHPILAA